MTLNVVPCNLTISKYQSLAPVYFCDFSKKLKKLSLDIAVNDINLMSTVVCDKIPESLDDCSNNGLDYSVITKTIYEFSKKFSDLQSSIPITEYLTQLANTIDNEISIESRIPGVSSISISCNVSKLLLEADETCLELLRYLGSALTVPEDQFILTIPNISVYTFIGLNAWECKMKQKILFDIKLLLEKHIAFPLNELIIKTRQYMEHNSYKTLEAASYYCCDYIRRLLCIYGCSQVDILKLSMSKPYANYIAQQISISWNSFPRLIDPILHQVYIGLGSNLGNRQINIQTALELLRSRNRIISISRLYISKPMYYIHQDDFLNACCHLETELSPQELLNFLQSIQTTIGRKESLIKKGPRIIDLDILYYDSERIQTDCLSIPHPGIRERLFVLKPLMDILEKCPCSDEPISSFLNELRNTDDFSSITPIIPFRNGSFLFDYQNRTLLMAILNMTPDSFSGDGEIMHPLEQTLKRIDSLIDYYSTSVSNSDDSFYFILDIGGASSRPGADLVSDSEEWNRIKPILEALRINRDKYCKRMLISLDTSNEIVARKAADMNILDLLNDSSGYGALIPVSIQYGLPIVLMHNKGTAKTMMSMTKDYPHCMNPEMFINDLIDEMKEKLINPAKSSLFPWNVIIDPGIGFAKDTQQDLMILRNFGKYQLFQQYPVLIGASRKKFIKACEAESRMMNLGSIHPRTWATAATCTAAISQGAAILRIHDLVELAPVCVLSDCIYKGFTNIDK